MTIKWKHIGNGSYFQSWSVLRLRVNLFIKVHVTLFFTYPVRTKSKILINKATHCINANLWSPSKVTFNLAFFTDVIAKTIHNVVLTGLANCQSVSNQLRVLFPLCLTDLDPALLMVSTVLGTTSTVVSETELALVLTEFIAHWEQPCVSLFLTMSLFIPDLLSSAKPCSGIFHSAQYHQIFYLEMSPLLNLGKNTQWVTQIQCPQRHLF